MPDRLPLFPLNTVLFPGLVLPLHVFEEHYQALVRDVLASGGAPEFGVVAIKIGYEIGEHGGRTIHSFGCVAQINDVTANEDGTFELLVRGTNRFRMDDVDKSGPYLVGSAELVPEAPGEALDAAVRRALDTFDEYRGAAEAIRGMSLLEGPLPDDADVLSYVLSATVVLELAQRQLLLEAASTAERLHDLTRLMRAELRAIAAVASLPATDIARTGWSPN